MSHHGLDLSTLLSHYLELECCVVYHSYIHLIHELFDKKD